MTSVSSTPQPSLTPSDGAQLGAETALHWLAPLDLLPYAVGVVAFEMMTGQRAFPGKSARDVFSKKMDPDYHPVGLLDETVVPAPLLRGRHGAHPQPISGARQRHDEDVGNRERHFKVTLSLTIPNGSHAVSLPPQHGQSIPPHEK